MSDVQVANQIELPLGEYPVLIPVSDEDARVTMEDSRRRWLTCALCPPSLAIAEAGPHLKLSLRKP